MPELLQTVQSFCIEFSALATVCQKLLLFVLFASPQRSSLFTRKPTSPRSWPWVPAYTHSGASRNDWLLCELSLRQRMFSGLSAYQPSAFCTCKVSLRCLNIHWNPMRVGHVVRAYCLAYLAADIGDIFKEIASFNSI